MQVDVITLTVHSFVMGTDKEAALKPLEEAAEVYRISGRGRVHRLPRDRL